MIEPICIQSARRHLRRAIRRRDVLAVLVWIDLSIDSHNHMKRFLLVPDPESHIRAPEARWTGLTLLYFF